MKSRTRARLLGLAVEGVGVVNIASALTPALRSRLALIEQVFTPEVARLAAGATALFGLTLVLLGRGIVQRRRLAYRAAVVILGLSTLSHLLKGLDVEEASVTAVLSAILVRSRALFAVGPGPARWRTLARAVPAIVALDFAYGLAGLLVRHSQVHPGLTPGLAFREVAWRLLGLPGPLSIEGGFGHWFPGSLTVFGSLSFLAIVLLALAPVADRRAAEEVEREEVRNLLDRVDGDSLDPFALRLDKRYVFSSDRRAAIAYRYVTGVGLASGDPVGEPQAFPDALARFLDLCERHGWRPAVLGARGDRLELYEPFGLRAFYLGDEAIVDVARFGLEGRRMRNVRQAAAHTVHLGITVEILREGDLDPTLRRALLGIADAWRGGAPERGFSMALGSLLTGRDSSCVIVVCRSPDGTLVAFQRYVPCRGGRALSLDAMPRDRGAPNGVNERMIAELVAWARDRGIEEVSLNFAAFRVLTEEDAELTPTEAAEAWLVRRLGRYFQIESLRSFNAKFGPRWVSRFLVYRSPGDLGAVAVAALSAESFLPFDRREEEPPATGSVDRGVA